MPQATPSLDYGAPLLQAPPELDGSVVLITGGTGSFGQAFARRLLGDFKPQKVIVFSRDEQKHFAMQGALPDKRLRFFVGDIRDRDRLYRALDGVDVVVHAAAMKHVPIAEYNPIEAIRTNIDGAANLIDAALERRVRRIVALSTDKAVSPVNLYGATKLCMEKLFVAANSYAGGRDTRFDLVRYGNVVGSRGSVVPLFIKQREQGRITLTDPAMTRFWIGMDRAVDLVLLALHEARGEVFVPKLPACRVDVLAEALAPAVQREVIGIRPGEKMHETLITADEARAVAEYDQYYIIQPGFPAWGARPRLGASTVATDFEYRSDVARQLSVLEVRELLGRLDMLGAQPPAS
jgi:UDP-N-acetylglucosamine 4,6-dehydratase